jgi:hypothetical protein
MQHRKWINQSISIQIKIQITQWARAYNIMGSGLVTPITLQYVIAIFCDPRKAFDCCNHKILLQKLNNLGMKGSDLTWFQITYLIEVKCPKAPF